MKLLVTGSAGHLGEALMRTLPVDEPSRIPSEPAGARVFLARPGSCRPSSIERVRVFPRAVIGNSIGTPLRILNWVGEWARRDPDEPHWHLGPVAVEPSLQGQGIRPWR